MVANFVGFPIGRSTPIIGAAAVANNTVVPDGAGLFVTATVAANLTLTLQDGSTMLVNPAVGDTIYPFAVTKALVNSGTVTQMYTLK